MLWLLMAVQMCQAEVPEKPYMAAWAHASRMGTQATADEAIAIAERAKLDALYLLVWHWAEASYETDLAPMRGDVDEGFDPLGYMVDECHERGIEVHAWYVNGSSGSPKSGGLFAEHPDWRMVNAAGSAKWWYDLGKAEVRAFQSDLMIDVLERYDVDGIHFDYIRHSSRETCYCDPCVSQFREQHGMDPAWFSSDSIPYTADFDANPIDDPTTATVLARFSNGAPAVYLNELGDGTVLGLNYHAQKLREAFAENAVAKALDGANTEGGVPVIFPPETAKDYGSYMAAEFVRALGITGHESRVVDGLPGDIAADGAVALVCAYRMGEQLA
ncbi:MAG TPA: family 10 glycosylhydrolase, partial [Armatimonadota bacterium]|nr:family 10 glycosylhydrolase [Armatimonadota bacterium]